jgi:hypothetical protein
MSSSTTAPDELMKQGRAEVERFFGESFPRSFEVKTFQDREALTDFARKRWGFEKTECWMVAMGVSSMIVVLSPDAWKTQACEHQPTPAHIREILTHELVHVYHGQHNPSHEFDGMDDVGWFVEGLAIHAAKQLTDERMSRFRKAIAKGQTPSRLADAWSGPNRYAICGSLVQFIETRWGRAMIKNLLSATSNAEILKELGVSEDELLTEWRISLAAPQKPGKPAEGS